MPKISLCDPYFWEQPTVLTGSAWWRRWSRPQSGQCASEIVNEIAAVYIFTAIIGATVSVLIEYPYALPLALLAATLYLIPAFYTLSNMNSVYKLLWVKECDSKEGFEPKIPYMIPANTNPVPGTVDTAPDMAGNYETNPTAKNPFMNVLVDEYKYNPQRPAAALVTSPVVNDALDSFFRVQWSSDPTDVFGRTQSQRQFVTMPSTSIPNDGDSYQNWLYRIPGKTCKEGGREACLPGTDGGPIPWLNQAL